MARSVLVMQEDAYIHTIDHVAAPGVLRLPLVCFTLRQWDIFPINGMNNCTATRGVRARKLIDATSAPEPYLKNGLDLKLIADTGNSLSRAMPMRVGRDSCGTGTVRASSRPEMACRGC